jgi:uncharacterized protein DUF2510
VSSAAGWYADRGQHPWRCWDGTQWTAHVAGYDGVVSTDLQWSEAAVTQELDTDPVWNELQGALDGYRLLLDDLQAERIDEATFRRRAFGTGLVVHGDEAWLLDLANQKLHHYDGFQLLTLDLPDSEG